MLKKKLLQGDPTAVAEATLGIVAEHQDMDAGQIRWADDMAIHHKRAGQWHKSKEALGRKAVEWSTIFVP